ncbi:MAG: hypothetical protein V4697_01310 [Patescibacteria group bacterium]
MLFRNQKITVLLVLLMCVVPSAHYIYAQVMTGTLYKVQSDSLNFGGGRSTSTTYISENTFGEIATGNSTSTLYSIGAGYQQMQAIYIAVTFPANNVVMSPAIGGLTGGTSVGSTDIAVTTDNPAGYTMTIKASSSPAMQSLTSSIADYTPAGADPDYNFSVASTDSELAFTPEGEDIVQRFRDNGSFCNTGSSDTLDKCWAPLSTSPQTIVTRNSPNHPGGTFTVINFRVGVGSARVQEPGTYIATTTVTILPQ